MLINHDRERLLQAAVFFAHNTDKLGRVKLFKLLYFLDFMSFRETGHLVTGLSYQAWDHGPVPSELFGELKYEPKADLTAMLKEVEIQLDQDRVFKKLVATVPFDDLYFSPFEVELMTALAAKFKTWTAEEMEAVTHSPVDPWYRVYVTENGKNRVIPPLYGVPDEDREDIEKVACEHEDFVKNYA